MASVQSLCRNRRGQVFGCQCARVKFVNIRAIVRIEAVNVAKWLYIVVHLCENGKMQIFSLDFHRCLCLYQRTTSTPVSTNTHTPPLFFIVSSLSLPLSFALCVFSRSRCEYEEDFITNHMVFCEKSVMRLPGAILLQNVCTILPSLYLE